MTKVSRGGGPKIKGPLSGVLKYGLWYLAACKGPVFMRLIENSNSPEDQGSMLRSPNVLMHAALLTWPHEVPCSGGVITCVLLSNAPLLIVKPEPQAQKAKSHASRLLPSDMPSGISAIGD